MLNINRPGYGGNQIPESARPILDSITLHSALIKKTYHEHSGTSGIILIGHSLGAAIALSLAAYENGNLPLLGVSALGLIPTNRHPASLVKLLEENPTSPHFVVEPSPEAIQMFMGPPEVIEESVLLHPSMPSIFEPGEQDEDQIL